MVEIKDKFDEKLDIDAILKIYKGGYKHAHNQKVGIEFERLPVSASDYKSVGYSSENGIYDLLRAIAKIDCVDRLDSNCAVGSVGGWEYITDDYNIIGLKKGEDRITLEPGCQVELSLKPEREIADIKSKVDIFNKKITPILKKHDIKLLEYGISPVSTYKHIGLIPKKRYHIMANYLWGILSDVMMRETAGIQACFDFSSEEDAMRKFKIANKLSPFMTAMFANSPIRGGVDTGYKTFRGLSWLNTDSERCGFSNKKLFENKSDYNFKHYIQDVMNTPMIFIMRDGKPVEILGKVDFDQFMKRGFDGYTATMDDFRLHANLYFPEVRLRNFIEIRNHDCANHGMQYSILAIYKGLLYNVEAMDAVEKLMSEYSYKDMMEFRYNVPRCALNTKVKNHQVRDVAVEILSIAQKALKENNDGEEKFLEPIMDLTLQGLTPADVILKNWNGSWNKDVHKLIKYLEN